MVTVCVGKLALTEPAGIGGRDWWGLEGKNAARASGDAL
jgi:hypothetical protein